MGITSYDSCQKFQEFELIKTTKTKNPYLELNRKLRDLLKMLRSFLTKPVFMLVCDSTGKVLHCDSGIGENLDYLLEVVKTQFNKKEVSEHVVISDGAMHYYGLFKLSENGLLVLVMQEDLKEDIQEIKSCVKQISGEINPIIEKFLLWMNFFEPINESSDYSFRERFSILESMVQGLVPVEEILKEIDLLQSLVAQIFAWHPLMYELSIIRQRLLEYEKDGYLSKKDKQNFLDKITKWKKLLV